MVEQRKGRRKQPNPLQRLPFGSREGHFGRSWWQPLGRVDPETPQEGLVLAAATLLTAAVFVQGRNGTLVPGVSLVLLTLVMLATAAALLHMLARLTR